MRVRRLWLTGAACVIGYLTGIAPAQATLIISAQAVSATPGSSGSFEVFLTNPGAPVTLGAFDFEVTTTNLGITFTDITINTVLAPYVYAGNSLLAIAGSILSVPPSTAHDAEGGDVPDVGVGTVIPTSGVFSLGLVQFTVAPNASPSGVVISFGPGTSLADDASQNITETSTPGAITITAATPEPALLLPSALALLLGACLRRGRAISQS